MTDPQVVPPVDPVHKGLLDRVGELVDLVKQTTLFVQEARSMVKDLKELYEERRRIPQFERDQDEAAESKDTSQIDRAFGGSSPDRN